MGESARGSSKMLPRLKHGAVPPAPLKEAVCDTVPVFVLLALYAARTKYRLPRKIVGNKTHVAGIWLGGQKSCERCSFPKAAQLLPLGCEICQPGTWALFFIFFLNFWT